MYKRINIYFSLIDKLDRTNTDELLEIYMSYRVKIQDFIFTLSVVVLVENMLGVMQMLTNLAYCDK